MQRRNIFLFFAALFVAKMVALPSEAFAQTERQLYDFNGQLDTTPSAPLANLVFDAAGNLYGTASDGAGTEAAVCGSYGCGAVFEMSPKAGGVWTTKVLHKFSPTLVEGYYPVASVLLDAAGNLYGVAELGGAGTTCGILTGFGVVFQLSPLAGGKWNYKILYNFGSQPNCSDGAFPVGGMVFDKAGNLYGTTELGGANNLGLVFKLSPGSDGSWTETVLHDFAGNDGENPEGALIFDSAGNLYGTTSAGNTQQLGGTVFELSPAAHGSWRETVLYRFEKTESGSGAYEPFAGVVFDDAGNLYGTTLWGGIGGCGCGTVFELTPAGTGTWTRKTLHNFTNNGVDGYAPTAGVTLDSSGNVYGTASLGGPSNSNCASGCGILYELKPKSDGNWTERLLHQFGSYTNDGTIPRSGVIFDSTGNLYGTTSDGGPKVGGTVYEFIR